MDKEKKGNNDNDNATINIHDCLKMIGLKEVAANIYSLPKNRKKAKA
jgi:hypothetical protein